MYKYVHLYISGRIGFVLVALLIHIRFYFLNRMNSQPCTSQSCYGKKILGYVSIVMYINLSRGLASSPAFRGVFTKMCVCSQTSVHVHQKGSEVSAWERAEVSL